MSDTPAALAAKWLDERDALIEAMEKIIDNPVAARVIAFDAIAQYYDGEDA